MTTTATSPPVPRAAVGRSRSLAPKIYHIAHVDRLASIVADGFLWCDAELQQRVRPVHGEDRLESSPYAKHFCQIELSCQ